jgi:hypothetical protein
MWRTQCALQLIELFAKLRTYGHNFVICEIVAGNQFLRGASWGRISRI